MTLTQSLEGTLMKIYTIILMTKMTRALALIAAYPASQDHSPKTNRQQRGYLSLFSKRTATCAT